MSNLRLSASRIKTFESCSWLYYCSYILKLPQSSNDGSNRGDVTHRVLECLLKPHRKPIVDVLLQDIYGCPAINKLVKIIAKQNGVDDPINLETIYKFLYVALKNDFYSEVEGGEVQPPEYSFEIGVPEIDGYTAVGFIDKYTLFPDRKFLSITDYKTSKSAFNQKELEENVQALMYSLAMHKKYPEYESGVQFLFLKFPKNPIRKVSFTKEQLSGFEQYLKSVYSVMSKFSYLEAKNDFAADKGFDYNWLCGKDVAYPGELKADGITPKWHCQYRFPRTYYAVVDEFGDNIRTSYNLEDLKLKEGEEVLKKSYPGCPRFFR